jgi:hypothetical protein
MSECLCTPEVLETRKHFREISCKCADVADKLIELGELSPERRCDFIIECFRREFHSTEEYNALFKLAKEKGWL